MSESVNTHRRRGRASKTLAVIDTMVGLAEEMQPCGVRALAYKLFGLKLIAAMVKNETKKVSGWCTIAREEGLMPWEWIEDETRQEECVVTWRDLVGYADTVQRGYRKAKWDDQPVHVMVWTEKATIVGSLRPVLRKYEVPLTVLHGWSGSTTVWDAAAANLKRHYDSGKPTLIIYVGDWDPSGMGMSEADLPKRLARYSSNDPADKSFSAVSDALLLDHVGITIKRVALTKADTIALGPGPRFPASDKEKDTRHPWFVRTYGDWCWELDALDPNVLRQRVEDAIVAVLDREIWDRSLRIEKLEMEGVASLARGLKGISVQDPICPDESDLN
jgi:hypothetical protein